MSLSNAIRWPGIACAIACAIATLAFTPHALAQDGSDPAMTPGTAGAADPDQVFATVDGEPVTAGDLLVAAEDFARQLGQQPGNVPMGELLNVLIDMRLVAQAAEAEGLDEDDAVQRRVAFERMQILRNVYLRDQALSAVTDEAVREQFDEETANFEPQEERRLSHILVETEDEGKEIIADLEAGGDFAEIAMEKSQDPGSASNGGALDFVGRGATVPEFEQAAFDLEVGEVTDEPVQSQFGWHVIRLEETRESSPPEFATEEQRIRNEMLREFITDKIAELRAAADIEIVEPEASADGDEPAPAEAPAQ